MHYYDVLRPKRCGGKNFDFLLALGWYPMGQSIFTTSHLFGLDDTPPRQVRWIRYSVPEVEERGSHRRIVRRNASFESVLVDPFVHTAEQNKLYEEYLNSVDFDGYESVEKATFKGEGPNIFDTRAITVRDGERLIACGIFHRGASAVASVLHFYDPRYKRYSLGKYLILRTLDYCRDRGIVWYYPGYVIQGDPKMDYKLFLGEEAAQYYSPYPEPLTGRWLPFSLS